MGLLSDLNIGSSLSNITSIVNQYVVSPLAAFGVAGFVFNALGESQATLSADITDHYAEDNKAIQDQIAIRPKRVTLKGYVGELVYNSAGAGPSNLNTLSEKLTGLTSFLPALTAGATQLQQAVTDTSSVTFSGALGTASNIYGLVQNTLGAFGNFQNQQNAYTYFKALMQSATLMGIQTPWEFMTNMAIETIVAVQPENSEWITDFAVTFKEVRIASTGTIAFTAGSNASGNNPQAAALSSTAGAQAAPVTNLGPIPGAVTSVTTSALTSLQQYGPILH